jgi:predicted permease
MRWIYKIPLRIRSLFERRRVEQELSDELRFHLEKLIEEKVAKGMTPKGARYAALRELGGLEQIKEECRDMRRVNYIENFLQDLRYGLRQLRRNPGFTAVAVLTLALGIGANTAIFSFINAIMFKMLSVKDPEQLVVLSWTSRASPKFLQSNIGSIGPDESGQIVSESLPYPALDEFRTHKDVLTRVFAFGADPERVNINVNRQARLAYAEMVSGNYFSGLGVLPLLGRPIMDADDNPGAPAVAVLSYAFWERLSGGDPAVVGKAAHVNGFAFTIVGVTPPEFFGTRTGNAPDLWVPLSAQPQVAPRWFEPGVSPYRVTRCWVRIMGRLKPGVSKEQARAALDVPFEHIVTAGVNPAPPPEQLPHIKVAPGSNGPADLRQQVSEPLFLLMGIVGLVLLIACSNVANLLLARATTRQREVAVRLALGAGRARLIRQLLTEVLLLFFLGGVLGPILAYAGTHVLLALISTEVDHFWLDISPDLHVLAFTAVVSLLTGILFGMAPVLRATRLDLTPALQENPGSILLGPHMGRRTLGRLLVGAQVAMSLMLVIVAGLFVRTLVNLKNLPLGFSRENLLLFAVDPTLNGYQGKRLVRFYEQLLERIEALPGVRGASLSAYPQIFGGESTVGILVPGYKLRPDEREIGVWCNRVGPDFLGTMGIKLLLGRDLSSRDTLGAPRVAVVNETMAHHYFGTATAVGHHFSLRGANEAPGPAIEIVGVAQDARFNVVRREPPPIIYLPLLQDPEALGMAHFEVSTSLKPTDLVPFIRRVVQEADQDVPIFDVATQRQLIDEALGGERSFAQFTSLFGLLAMGLASVGVYGLTAYSVGRRTREIGIRMALGAQHAQVLWMALRESLFLAALGIAAGLAAALAATRVLASILFELTPTDPATLFASTLVIAAAAAVASYLPARRAAKIDPIVALRYE